MYLDLHIITILKQTIHSHEGAETILPVSNEATLSSSSCNAMQGSIANQLTENQKSMGVQLPARTIA